MAMTVRMMKMMLRLATPIKPAIKCKTTTTMTTTTRKKMQKMQKMQKIQIQKMQKMILSPETLPTRGAQRQSGTPTESRPRTL